MARDTRAQILDVAERLVQRRGYNGFSYAVVAAEVGVTKATLHYHFAGKSELGAALIERYAGRFLEALARIDREGGDARRRLRAFAAIYADVLRERRMCLCGRLAADYKTLPKPMQGAVVRLVARTEVVEPCRRSSCECARPLRAQRYEIGGTMHALDTVLAVLAAAVLPRI